MVEKYINALDQLISVLSDNLLQHPIAYPDLSQKTLRQELQKIRAGLEAMSEQDEATAEFFFLTNLDSLFNTLNSLHDDLYIDKALAYLLAGFIHRFITPINSSWVKHSSYVWLEKYLSEEDADNSINFSAFIFGHQLFDSELDLDDSVYIHLHSAIKLNFDKLGMDLFSVRRKMQPLGPSFTTFYEMLQKCELTGGSINFKDHLVAEEVPQRVHLIWCGGIPSEDYKKNILSWKELNPGFNVVLYMEHTDVTDGAFLKFQAWCKSKNILIVNIYNVISHHPDADLFEDANNAKKYYGASANNYGAASDIARCIILQWFKGIYADVPDVQCVKAFPEHFSGNKLVRTTGRFKNNDYIIVGDGEGQKAMQAALVSIAKSTWKGFSSLMTLIETTSSVALLPTASSAVRESILTVARTGTPHLYRQSPYFDSSDGSVLTNSMFSDSSAKSVDSISSVELEDWVVLYTAGTWSQQFGAKVNLNHELMPLADDQLAKRIAAGLTGMVHDLRLYPFILNIDKYPIFQNPRALKIGLVLLCKFFPDLVNNVKNIVAFTTRPEVLLPYLTYFSNLKLPFIHTVCATASDSSLEQISYVRDLLQIHPEYVYLKNKNNSSVLLTACKASNFLLAQELMDFFSVTEISAVNNKKESAFYFCGLVTGLLTEEDLRLQIIHRMLDKGYQINIDEVMRVLPNALMYGATKLAKFLFDRLPLELQLQVLIKEFDLIEESIYDYPNKVAEVSVWMSEKDRQEKLSAKAEEIYYPFLEHVLSQTWPKLDRQTQQNYEGIAPQVVEKFTTGLQKKI